MLHLLTGVCGDAVKLLIAQKNDRLRAAEQALAGVVFRKNKHLSDPLSILRCIWEVCVV